MHSSRMRTARSSSRRGRGLYQAPPPPPEQAPPPREQAPPGPDPPMSWHPLPPGSRHPPGPDPLDQASPLVDRHTPVNILPCPKLRFRAVKIPFRSRFLLTKRAAPMSTNILNGRSPLLFN